MIIPSTYVSTFGYTSGGTTTNNVTSYDGGIKDKTGFLLVRYNTNIETTGVTYNYEWVTNTGGTVHTNSQDFIGYIGQWRIIDSRTGSSRVGQFRPQHRHTPRLRGRPSFVDTLSPAEIKALQLLKNLVNPENFRKYLKYGFVTVRGMSGLKYNVYRRKNTIVYDGQTEVASLCVHLKGNQPPTDEVIAKVLMCECEEHEIWKRSNCSFRNRTPTIKRLGFDKKAA